MAYEMAAGQRGQQLLFSSMAELVPLTQSLIPASLAQAFGIPVMEAGFGMSSTAPLFNFAGFPGTQFQQAPPAVQNPPAVNFGGLGAAVRGGADCASQPQLQSGPSSSFATNNRSSISSHPAPSHTIQSQQVSFSTGRGPEADRTSTHSGSYASPSSTMSGPPVYPSAQTLQFHHPYAQSMLAAAQQGSSGFAPSAQGPYFPTAGAQNPMMSYYGRDPAAYPMGPPAPGPYNAAAPSYQGPMYDYSAMPGAFRGPPSQPQFAHAESNDDEYNDDGTRAVKRPRLVWTPQLHKKFEVALNKLGPDKAVPKNIMQEMNIDGLTRENVASHLQKYRMLRKKGDDSSFGSDSDLRSDSGGTAADAVKDNAAASAALAAQNPQPQNGTSDRTAQPSTVQPAA